MPPRFTYWTILVGGLPTAFRAAERAEIEPTFKQLQHKHPDAELRWFARGRLWASPAEASEALSRQKAKGQRPNFPDRDRSWRPGGSHRDPRQPYKDAKKRENQKRRERRFEFKKKGSGLQTPGARPHREQPTWKRRPGEDKPETEKPWKPRSRPKAWSPKPEGRGPRTGPRGRFSGRGPGKGPKR